MKNRKYFLYRTIRIISVILICFLGLILRVRYHNSVPRPGESLDEYANAWSGLGLIEIGIPVGWSYLESDLYQPAHHYINVDNVYQVGTVFANPFYLHSPWLDHPPGMGLLVGGFAYLKGARVLEDATTLFIRKPMIILGTFNIFLLFLIGYLYFNYKTGVIASLIYSVSPLIVVTNRLPQAENAFIPIFLLSIILIKLFQNRKKYFYFFLSALIAGTGIWFKIPALMIAVSGSLLILFSSSDSFKNRFKLSLSYFFISASFGFLPLLAYGLAIDPKAFFQVILFHSQRSYGIGLSALYQLFVQSKVTSNSSLTDGWLLFGWFSWLIILTKIKNNSQKCIVFIPLFICLIFFIFLGSEFYGWYVFPFFPWLALSIAIMFSFLQYKPILTILSILITLPFQILSQKLNINNIIPNFTNYWRFGFALYLFFICLCHFTSNKILIKTQKLLIYIWFIFNVYLSIKYSYSLDSGIWLSTN